MDRDDLERETSDRLRHDSAEDVRTTLSFARAERLFGREYHGRFLIELLQNAADAWRSDARSRTRASRVAIVLTDEPALVVANEGVPITADVIVESLGHIGASNKPEGEAIGHKGIGFKSVLELSRSPEIYSGFSDASPDVAVRFDPRRALQEIESAGNAWVEYFANAEHESPAMDGSVGPTIPVLRYPFWVDDLPSEVRRLGSEGFDTIIRLPFESNAPRDGTYDRATWLRAVRTAMGDVTDRILVLLGSFGDVLLDDRISGTVQRVRPRVIAPGKGAGAPERVEVLRNDGVSSEWLLFRDVIDLTGELGSEIAVGVRIVTDNGTRRVVGAEPDHPAAPFHLFFPTRIESGSPFLLHGYFQVDAARTGFFRGAEVENRRIVESLAELASGAVEYAAGRDDIDLVGLVDLMAAAGEPEDSLARYFREKLLDHLDGVGWIPTADGTDRRSVTPSEALVAPPRVVGSLHDVFPARYIGERTSLALPHPDLSDDALELVAGRASRDGVPWDVIGALCRPGELPLWEGGEGDVRFTALLRLVDALRAESDTRVAELLDGLRGDPEARLIPAVSADGGRVLLPVPNPAEGVAGDRSRMVMARVRTWGADLVPPDELDLAFLPAGMLDSESEIDRARPFGVRPFTVNNVVDRLNGVAESGADPADLLRFLWRLLSREPVGSFATRTLATRSAEFAPEQWFWCRPGRAADDDNARLQQQRERYLADVRVPCRDGEWRSGATVAFGDDWARWLEDGACPSMPGHAREQRAHAYRALAATAPVPDHLIASPTVVLDHFGDPPAEDDGQPSDRDVELESLGFLLRLGVWEVVPVEAFESRARANRKQFPWSGQAVAEQQTRIEHSGGWTFDTDWWKGERHHNVYLAEDYRFRWSLDDAARRDAAALTTSLDLGAELYGRRRHAIVFCGLCTDNGGTHRATRQSTAADGYPSVLAVELNQTSWIPATVDGQISHGPVAPAKAWWHRRPPEGSGLRQSPWRMVPLCGPPTGVTERLHRLAGTNTIEDAPLDVVADLLRRLRADFDANALAVDVTSSGSARQAFVGLHRLAYGRLAELETGGDLAAAASLDEIGVLCELGDRLVYRPPGDVRHDDGTYAGYVRHFVGKVPLVVLQRTDDSMAHRLGVDKLHIRIERRGDDDGLDVTDELHEMLADRIPELLAIVVHHSLGTDTLELSSTRFEERSRRLQNVRVRQVGDLVVDASVDGMAASVTIGHGADRDVFIENAVSAAPVIYHDFAGVGWPERLRKKLAPLISTMLENPAYAHTFALFLQQETDAEREEFLIELGITNDEVHTVASRVGVIGIEERDRRRRWFSAVAKVLGVATGEADCEPGELLARTKLPLAAIDALLDAGGGEWVRRDASDDGAVALLTRHGVDLTALDRELIAQGDPGLDLRVGRQRFRTFLDVHTRRLVAVLQQSRSSSSSDDDASTSKQAVSELQPSSAMRAVLDPATSLVIEPVIDLLGAAARAISPGRWDTDAANALVEIGGFASVEELDEHAERWFDDEERARYASQQAASWRRQIGLLAVIARTAPTDTLATIRRLHDDIDRRIDTRPASPAELADQAQQLLADTPELGTWLVNQLTAPRSSPPTRDDLLRIAAQHGLDLVVLPTVERALDAPRRNRAAKVRRRVHELTESNLRPTRPPELLTVGPAAGPDGERAVEPNKSSPPTKVPKIKVDPAGDRRKRQAGDEGEEWALAAVVRELMDASWEQRSTAIDEIEDFLARFEGEPVDAACAHATAARRNDLDEDDLVEELTGLLHLSRHSDAFGMDIVGWLPLAPGGPRHAIGLEVKSTAGESFNLSVGEWRRAEQFHERGEGDRYAVLVVQRSKSGGPPAAMDLLADPVALRDAGQLSLDVDGYRIAYRSQ